VMTDSIEAAAVRATGSTEQAALRSVAAGDDIVLTTGQGSWNRVYRALLGKAQASKPFRARVRESAARVLALQRTLK
jgi:beta-N-acetylhexosaminidase